MQSPAFSRFRELMDKWDECLALEDEQNAISSHLDGNQCILFFKRGDDLFGAPEESRLVFAKMKSNDDDMPAQWKDQAGFIALNLLQSLLGQRTENMFGAKDLDAIKLLDKESVVAELMKLKNKGKDKADKKDKKKKK